MRRFIKLLTFLIIVLIALGTVGFVWAKHFVSTNWKNYYTETEIQEFVSEIDNSQSLPANIYEAYELVNPNQLNKEISDMENSLIWSLIVGEADELSTIHQCNCINAAERFKNRFPTKYHSLSWLFLGHALEQGTSELKCFDYLYSRYLGKLSNQHFNRPLDELTFNEAAELVILSEQPAHYSQHPELLYSRLTEILTENTAHNNR
jgi:membrane peptidoglycan carboxypeptidase